MYRHQIKFFGLFFLLIVVFFGCSSPLSYHAIRQSFLKVDRLDGISREEAVILAQYHIISKGLGSRLYSLEPFDIEEKNIWEKNGEIIEFIVDPPEDFSQKIQRSWIVLFKDKQGSLLNGYYPVEPFYVEIDRKSGEIFGWGIKK